MKQKQSISSPKKGLNRDSDIAQLTNIEYTFLLNGTLVNESGDSMNVQNEPSNQFGVRFPLGYKVLGFKNDILSNRTYYFITNPATKKSSIGYVINEIVEVFNKDIEQECPDCEYSNVLGQPLENTIQIPTLQYIELINDNCHIDAGREGLNFDINFPAKKIEIKQEKLETKLYWNDNRNGKRHLNVSNIESNPTAHYLITQEVPCADDVLVNCILVDKLLVFPKHNKIQIIPEVIQIGGNLKMGTYEFYVTYCDLLGNEMTNYSTPTNPICIFDENNNIMTQTGVDDFTNYSIKLKVKNLDSKNFKYYKVVCVERNNVDNYQAAFVEGIHNTTDDTVVYTHSGGTVDNNIVRGNASIKRRIDLNTLSLVKPHYDKAESTMVSGRRLWSKGLTKREEINLQPVVNIFGNLAFDWQSAIAHKDLYKNPVANSLYKYYSREEVQPLAIRFYFKDGDYTANFPIIGRPPTTDDLKIVTGVNVDSVNLNNEACITSPRNKKWQIEDTATVYAGYCQSSESGVSVTEKEVRVCNIPNVKVIPSGYAVIEIDQKFRDLKTYIEDNYDEVTNPSSTLWIPSISPWILNPYASSHCTPMFDANQCALPPNLDSQKNSIGVVNLKIPNTQPLTVGIRYVINTLVAGDSFTNVGYVKNGEYFTAIATTPTTWTSTEVFVEEKTLIESSFPAAYQDTSIKQSCIIYRTGDAEGVKIDSRADGRTSYAHSSLMPCGQYIVERDFQFTNTTPNTAEEVQTVVPTNGYNQSYFNDYELSSDVNTLIDTTKTSSAFSAGWYPTLHKKAMWFKVNNSKNKFIFEVTPQKLVSPIRDNVSNGQIVRLTFFKSKTTNTPFYTVLVDLTIGSKFLFEKTATGFNITSEFSPTPTFANITNGDFYVAVDCKIVSQTGSDVVQLAYLFCINNSTTSYRIAPTDGCYSIVTRDIEYSSAQINWQELSIDKTETYSSLCTFNTPKVTECEPKAYQKGKFAYWQSTEKYPDNNQLYNSAGIKIKPTDLANIPTNKKQDFEDYYKQSIDSNGNYVYKNDLQNTSKSSLDFTCQPIRHPKFPSQALTPYLYSGSGIQKFAETPIFPLGISVDNNVIRTMLQVAKNNGYITQKDLDNIDSFEIIKGDNTIHKSVMCSGMGFDMYNYTKKDGEKFWYANAPFNDLGADKFHTTDEARQNLIQHPFGGVSNMLYSFISPDLLLTRLQVPTEAVITGFQYGNAIQSVVQQQEFPKYTILGEDARDLAETLAIAEVLLEFVLKTAELITQSGVGHSWVFVFASAVGAGGGSNVTGTSLSTAAIIAYSASQAINSFVKVGQYRLEWLKTFRDLGATHNFAHFTAGVAKYNKFKIAPKRELRGLTIRKQLRDGLFNYVDKGTGNRINVNNELREDSALLSFGNFSDNRYNLNYPLDYVTFDNNLVNSKSSKIIAGDVGCETGTSSIRDVASPIITLKNYIPDQWGTIDSVNWLTTNYMFKINEDTSCKPIFGGTMTVSPFTYRRKLKLFREDAMYQPDKSPFDYSKSSNIGFTRYFVDYETSADLKRFGIFSFPDIVNTYNFDCETGRNGFYVKTPSKFYTHTHGVIDFLVESEINCHFRYMGKDSKEWFYRDGDNISEKLQEKNLPIVHRERLYYNNAYSFQVSNTPFKFLDYTYDKEIWRKRNIQPNACIYSEMDNNENDLIDPWLVYKPLNWYEFDKSLGKLINLKDLESYQFMAMFENGRLLHNAVDTIADKLTQQNKEIGMAGVFAQRPMEFKRTDLGFEGTQHSDICSTPYGHFWVDAKRGRVLHVDNGGKDLQVISEQVGNQQTNIKQWFREHLPLKIWKQLPDIDIDNKFKGIGFNIWYDDRNSRIFFTKRDYVLRNGVLPSNFIFDKETLKLKYLGEEVYFDNISLFEDVSWTISYNPTMGTWGSYFSFHPDYSPFNTNYFQVGYNWGVDKETLWNHTMNNSSFQVFQGRLNPFIVEFPIANENANKMLNSIALTIESKRYQNQWDTALWKEKGFNKLTIWNNTNNSGVLNLVEQKNIIQARKYPITNTNGTQDIMFTPYEGKHNINYFFNRAINQDNNIPQWIKDKNNIFKTINPKAVSFTGKRTNERLKGETFLVRLTNDKESRFNISLKNTINNETLI